MKVWTTIANVLRRSERCAMVSITSVEGSAPREEGTRMVVTAHGYHGTIGGGALEWRAIATAQAMIAHREGSRSSSHALGPELGQCCGGRVSLVTEVFDMASLAQVEALAMREQAGAFSLVGRIVSPSYVERFGDAHRPLFLFGAGHVGRALVLALAPLPFDVRWIDSREGAFPGAVPQNAATVLADNPVDELGQAKDGSFVLIMTHSHALDLALTAAALADPKIAYVGLIGSATKRARFEKRLKDGRLEAGRIAELVCPIGVAGIRSKLPAAIAAATAAQLLERDELLRSGEKPLNMADMPARMTR
jgi:xanthine dehydrogenase accessory factor